MTVVMVTTVLRSSRTSSAPFASKLVASAYPAQAATVMALVYGTHCPWYTLPMMMFGMLCICEVLLSLRESTCSLPTGQLRLPQLLHSGS